MFGEHMRYLWGGLARVRGVTAHAQCLPLATRQLRRQAAEQGKGSHSSVAFSCYTLLHVRTWLWPASMRSASEGGASRLACRCGLMLRVSHDR